MSTVTDLEELKDKEDTLTANKVANFCYTNVAYEEDDADGVSRYDYTQEQNIPESSAGTLKVNATVLEKGLRSQGSSLSRMLVNHFFGRVSYNLNKLNDIMSSLLSTLKNSVGQANGIASLDANGRIPYSQLPESSMELKGSFNASTGVATLLDGTEVTLENGATMNTNGDFYICDVAGTYDFGDGEITFSVNDRVLSYGTGTQSVFRKLSSGDVKSVNNKTPVNGNIQLVGTDIPATTDDNTNLINYMKKLFTLPYLGRNWTQSTDATTYSFYTVYYANGIWVVGSDSHGIWWSTDGKTWTQSTGATSNTFNTVYYANSIWVAGSHNQGIWWSTDGKTWTQSTDATTRVFNTVYYANGIWVAGSNNYGIWWSTDGKTWTQSTGATSNTFRTVYYAKGIWVAGSSSHGIWWSTDGKTWTQSTDATTYSFYTVYYANGIWIAGSSSGIWWSTDGKTWTQSTDGTTHALNTFYYANGIWVAGSYNQGIWWSSIDNLQNFPLLDS